jgi:penicillin amidase
LVETDEVLRTVGLKRAAEKNLPTLSEEELTLTQAYVDGINKFYELHEHNPPVELAIFGLKPQPWEVADSIAMASIVAFTFAFGGLSNEILRVKTIQKVGINRTLELFPVDYTPAVEFLQSLDDTRFGSNSTTETNALSTLSKVLGPATNELVRGLQSNNWVVSGDKTASGHPILSNDPHTSLEAQGIWYRVNLLSTDEETQLQGFTFPGIPLLAFGHNKNLAWGVTSGLMDSVDLFYLKENGTHYLVNDTDWKPFESLEEKIEVHGGATQTYTVRISEFGPMMETELGEYAMMWTLYQGYDRNRPSKSLVGFNTANTVSEFHEALKYMLTGFNWVFASVTGDIGYQHSGFIPVRKYGYGLVPKNGSTSGVGWDGLVDYEEQLFVTNPEEGFFATANEKVDTRDNFYISDSFAHRYRNDRIEQVLDTGKDFELNPNAITLKDMQHLQMDVKTLVAEDLLDQVVPILETYEPQGDHADLISQAIADLLSWDQQMTLDSVAATIFATYRIFLIDEVVRDELGDIADSYSYTGVRTVTGFLADPNNSWFDDITTTPRETSTDIVIRAVERTVNYLIERRGEDMDQWRWGQLHQVYLPHPFSAITDIFNIGPEPAAGSTFTVNAIAGPAFDGKSVNYKSSYGPYFRMVIEVEDTWSNMWGMVSSGASGNPLNPHYDDAYYGWLNYDYHLWVSSIHDVESNYTLTAEFRSKEQ